MCACVRVYVCASACACVRARVRACVVSAGTLVGKVPSISRRKLSILLRPSSSTEAPTDQMRLNRNHSATMWGRFSASLGFTWRGGAEGGEREGHVEVRVSCSTLCIDQAAGKQPA